jgi:glycosyltransferase involved in cell wall biosynthesis
MNKKRKILIVTANDYLAYQPSILNLYDFLQPFFDTTIISFEPEFIGNQKPDGRNIIYLKTPSFFKALVKKIDYFLQLSVKLFKPVFRSLSLEFSFYQRLQLFYLKLHLYKMQADEYLAVDIPALYVSQRVFGKCHFFSLELGVKDPYREKIRLENIQSVVIQNKARFNFLFQDAKLPVFYVQNAPVFDESMIKTYDRENIIWAGTILRRFAVLDCIEFVKSYPTYKLILKGGAERKTLNTINEVYKPLLESGILVIDRSYSPLDGFIDYLSHFKIGLCFYSWSLIGESINYQTAPSGKLFMYLAAGVPVIACNIPGFQFVREFGAGILIDDYRPLTIYNAVKRIEADYDSMQMACYQAARHFSFDKTVKPFIEFLLPTREFVSTKMRSF